ncbi:MAG TPA: adenylate/guanylate cyclase domain-containing protein [Roseimicrobium sp.]|nr:adenylate/guanylate cyclase domain-containing protein [Roseimicrobium sp.]
MPIRIRFSYGGEEFSFEFAKEEILIGRVTPVSNPDLNLGADPSISRRHARIWNSEGGTWIEDAGSSYGTRVNGVQIQAPTEIDPQDSVILGSTELQLLPPLDFSEAATVRMAGDEAETVKTSGASAEEDPEVDIATVIDNAEQEVISAGTIDTNLQKRLSLLFELPLQFAAETHIDRVLQLAVEQVVQLIPGASRGALLIYDPDKQRFSLKAHVPAGDAAVSESLARKAISGGQGFVWSRSDDVDPTESMRRFSIQTGMYAPMIWKGVPLGVMSVDNPNRNATFTEQDLRLLMAVAHYAAAALANHRLQEELRMKSVVLERLLTNFSPKLRGKLLEKALAGQLRPGGEKSQVTILFSDIRGFTKMSAGMDAGDVVHLLNDYFPALVNAIFRHDGTVDKFVGDAILAVFGSPEADLHHHEKAVLAALAMQEAMKQVNARRKAAGEVVCEVGIGVHSGEVLHGFIGAAERLEFTVIGDAVNKACRYCDGAQPGEILISPAVHEQAYRTVHTETLSIPTKHEGNLPAYRVTGLRKQG